MQSVHIGSINTHIFRHQTDLDFFDFFLYQTELSNFLVIHHGASCTVIKLVILGTAKDAFWHFRFDRRYILQRSSLNVTFHFPLPGLNKASLTS